MAVPGPCSGVTGPVTGGVTALVIRSPGCGHGLTRHYSASSAGDLGSLLLTISWSPLVAPMLSRRPSPYRSPLPLAFTRPTILRASMCGPRWPLRSAKLACATWPRSWSMRPGSDSPRQRSGAPARRSSSWREGQPSGWPARDFPHGRARQSPERPERTRRTGASRLTAVLDRARGRRFRAQRGPPGKVAGRGGDRRLRQRRGW